VQREDTFSVTNEVMYPLYWYH